MILNAVGWINIQ